MKTELRKTLGFFSCFSVAVGASRRFQHTGITRPRYGAGRRRFCYCHGHRLGSATLFSSKLCGTCLHDASCRGTPFLYKSSLGKFAGYGCGHPSIHYSQSVCSTGGVGCSWGRYHGDLYARHSSCSMGGGCFWPS